MIGCVDLENPDREGATGLSRDNESGGAKTEARPTPICQTGTGIVDADAGVGIQPCSHLFGVQ